MSENSTLERCPRLVTICAWCVARGTVQPPPHANITHGICDGCAAELLLGDVIAQHRRGHRLPPAPPNTWLIDGAIAPRE